MINGRHKTNHQKLVPNDICSRVLSHKKTISEYTKSNHNSTRRANNKIWSIQTKPTVQLNSSSPWGGKYPSIVPVSPKGVRSHSNKWLSVPLVTNLQFLLSKADAKACAFFFTCRIYTLYSGEATCFNAMARAAIWLLWGPPCNDGKTEKFILSSKS